MSLESLPEMRATYGDGCVYLLGGHLLRFDREIGSDITKMRAVPGNKALNTPKVSKTMKKINFSHVSKGQRVATFRRFLLTGW